MNRIVILIVALILSACATTHADQPSSPPEAVADLVELATANNKEEGDDALRAIANHFNRHGRDGWVLRFPNDQERKRLTACKCACGYLVLARQDQRWQVTVTGCAESPVIFPLE